MEIPWAESLDKPVCSTPLSCYGHNRCNDVSDDPVTVKLNSLLDDFGLLQHVRAPTYRGGHTLDMILTRS